MNRFLGVIILMALATGVWAQSGQNPFDLKYRRAKPMPVPEKETDVQQQDTTKVISPAEVVDTTQFVIASTPQDSTIVDTALIADSLNEAIKTLETGIGYDSTRIQAESDLRGNTEEAKSIESEPSPRKFVSRGFQIFFLLLSLLFLIFIVNVERSFIRDLWRVISNENYSSLHHRNQRNTMRQILLLMGYLIFIFQAGLFIQQSLYIHQITDSVLTSIWVSIAVVLGVYLVRHGVIRYLKWLFNNEKELSLFAFDISIFNTMVGLILLPINILLIFGPDKLYNTLIIIGIVVIGVAYLLRQLRWLMASRRFITHSLLLFFIYLCAVEILPLWTISKIFW